MITHGLAGTYRNGCRCEECCQANTARARIERASRAARTPPPEAHGKASTYINWECRCTACSEAHSIDLRARRQRRQRARGAA